ncbi:aldehyde dehydrogenase [Aquitalea magnusonii]|uniref:Aldehyde dehydrogenase n=1 Tax=Aquitalea magnusonii TaxID=332411 RepID=A0A3G9GHA6_9NEIS|nr:coniferyl aldehyde dehydrogenase [Aquitalea magnusonii]BBF85631.1 aldehyde dehydrogenase [Aquitalea magnusonii]
MNVLPMMPGTETALQHGYAALRLAADSERFPGLARRRGWLDAVEKLLQENRQALIDAINADFGQRSSVETQLGELFPSLEELRRARRKLAVWMRPQRRPVSIWFRPARNRLLPQPLGVVGIVVPWNYPLFLALGPLIGALAAGNRVMIKMSELTPATGALLAALMTRYFEPGVVSVVNGGPELSQAFTRLPFDHLLFTGSTAVGRHVMRAAADNLTPVTLELGGKSPAIVARDADFARAAESIVAGKLFNAGQTCVAPDYVLVNAKDRDRLLAMLDAAATRAYPTLAHNPDYSSIIHPRHYQRLQQWLDEAAAAGADIRQVNPAAESLQSVRKMPLTLVLNSPPHCALMQEEIFGPILPIISYDRFEDAISYINARPRPLALYLFDRDPVRIDKVLQQTISGGVCINETILHVVQDAMPFGGVGASGMGHYHGYEGFLTFSKLKPVFEQSRWAGTWLTRPPYGRAVQWLLRLMLRG